VAVCGVVLAAGRGTRLAPFSDHRPKPSFPIGDRSLLHRAVDELRAHVDDVAVNVSGHPDWFRQHTPTGVRLFEEGSEPLGTAGALRNMEGWIAGRDVVVLNADSVLFGNVAEFVEQRRPSPTELLVAFDPTAADFDGLWRFAGLSKMTSEALDSIDPASDDLYYGLWKAQLAAGDAQLVPFKGVAVDCGTPSGLLAANLIESGGRTVIESGATLEGEAVRCLLLRGAHVGAGDRFHLSVVDAASRVSMASGDGEPVRNS
jgi:N-acetyl-alpha-D-muramate 1-phosphate uridylyltransferase